MGHQPKLPNTAFFKPDVHEQHAGPVFPLRTEALASVMPAIPLSSDADCLQVYV